MSNLYLILSNAYSRNTVQEFKDARVSANNISKSWGGANERDVAKVLGADFKILGTMPLVLLGLSVLHVLKNRTASIGRIFFSTFYFFAAADLLKASHNLSFEYTMTRAQKVKFMKLFYIKIFLIFYFSIF